MGHQTEPMDLRQVPCSILQKPDVDNSIGSMSFNSSPFWVQLHNVSLSRMSKENAESIRASIGEVEEVDVPASGQGYGRFLRIRVKVEIRQPFCRGRLVDLGDKDPIWVAFPYERRPMFCYKCGKLNHDERECQGKSKFRGNQRSVESQYGPWLKADPGKMQKTQVIEGQDKENEEVARNQDSSNMEISVKQVENQDRADIIVQGVGKGNLGIERLGILTLSGIKCRPSYQSNPYSQSIRTDLEAQFTENHDALIDHPHRFI